jgi:hypothetical protein
MVAGDIGADVFVPEEACGLLREGFSIQRVEPIIRWARHGVIWREGG